MICHKITLYIFSLKGVQQEETGMHEKDEYGSKEMNVKEVNDGYDSKEVDLNLHNEIFNESTQVPKLEGQFLELPNQTEENAKESNMLGDQPSIDSTTLTTSQDLKLDETITESPIYLHIHLPEESGKFNHTSLPVEVLSV